MKKENRLYKIQTDPKRKVLFFFSQEQKSIMKMHQALYAEKERKNEVITADGQIFEYTEMMDLGKISNFPDAIFIAEDYADAIIHNGKPFKRAKERLKDRENRRFCCELY